MSPLGLKLTDGQLRCAVALRLGAKICAAHTCCCGQNVDEYGTHGLSCKRSAGRFARHAFFNEFFRRFSASVAVPSFFRASGVVKDRWQTTRWCDSHPLAARKAAGMGRDFRGFPCPEQSATAGKLFSRGWNPKNLEIGKYRGAGLYFPTNRHRRPRKLRNSNRNFCQVPDKKIIDNTREPSSKTFFINACQWPCNSLTYHA